ncbi:protein FAM200A-like [Myzus persicae]|uniref:protein FAM200A-like n=1 Tax=Myzus persicae TaxID=13164 RepID=UPI000B9382FE|nr:protein FAM200A-like [Myzus persicae]
MTNHSSKYDKYTGVARENVVIDLKRKLQTQQNVMVKATTSQQLSLMASYVISNEIAKSKKSLNNGEFIKNCTIKMAKSINENRIASEFEKISLSRRTVTRRIADTDSVIRETLQTIMMNCAYFSIALDESTDVSDVSQLLIFVRVISLQFEMYEELLELCSLHGSTKGIDIFNAVKNAIEPFGGFKKMSSVVTDGAKSMVGKNIGFVGLLRKSDINVPAIHCIIHQEALCGKIMKLDNIMNTVFKITNLIRGGNRSLNHHNFIKYLEELDCEYGDLLLHTDVRWLSRGKCLERFFDLRKEILNFLKTNITTDTTYFENQLVDKQFLCSLAFLTDISQHINKLNLQLQVIKQEFDNEFNFEHCITHIDELIVELKRRFEEIELMRPQIN